MNVHAKCVGRKANGLWDVYICQYYLLIWNTKVVLGCLRISITYGTFPTQTFVWSCVTLNVSLFGDNFCWYSKLSKRKLNTPQVNIDKKKTSSVWFRFFSLLTVMISCTEYTKGIDFPIKKYLLLKYHYCRPWFDGSALCK